MRFYWQLIIKMMCLGGVLGLGFDWEGDGVGFEEGRLPQWQGGGAMGGR